MRARNLKPGIYTNEYLARLGANSFRLFTALWCMADRQGRLEDRPEKIEAGAFPFKFQRVNIEELLDGLGDGEDPFIVRYEINGSKYIQIVNFLDHQNPHPREAPSSIPPWRKKALPRHGLGKTLDMPSPADVLNPDVLNPESPFFVTPSGRTNELKPYKIPLPEEQPADALVILYKILQGVPYDYRPWDGAWGRWKKKAIELLAIFEGNFSKAYSCMKTKGDELTAAQRTWTLNTIVDGAHLWKQQHGGEAFADINRSRFLREVNDQRQQKRIAGLRRTATDVNAVGRETGVNGLSDALRDRETLSPTGAGHHAAPGERNDGGLGKVSAQPVESASNRQGEDAADDGNGAE